MKSFVKSFALASALVIGVSGAAFAQATAPVDPGHPRVNQVEQRITNQQNRVNAGVASGKISATQAAKDDAKLAREQKSLTADEAKKNGHITKAEQKNLNDRLNQGSQQIKKQ